MTTRNKLDLKQPLIGVEYEAQFSLPEFPNSIAMVSYAVRLRGTGTPMEILDHHPIFSEGRLKGVAWIFCNPSYFDNFVDSCLTIDSPVSNAELRTNPTNLSLLANEMEDKYKVLMQFASDISLHTKKGVGVFLPKVAKKDTMSVDDLDFSTSLSLNHLFPMSVSRPTKHVNFSFSKDVIGILSELDQNELYFKICTLSDIHSLSFFRSHILLKCHDMKYSSYRLHITVPYNFSGYSTLMEYARLIWFEADRDYVIKRFSDLMVYLDSWVEHNLQKDPIFLGYAKRGKFTKVHDLI